MGAAAVIAATVLSLPPAGAAPKPILRSVTIQGQAVVGETLKAVAVTSDPAAVVEYRWQRCPSDLRSDCTRIQTAPNAPSYTVVVADAGNRLAVRAVAVLGTVQEAKWSALTSVVTSAPVPPPAPSPTPGPTPTPDPTPDPASDPVPDPVAPPSTFDQSAVQSAPPAAGPPTVKAPPYLRPYPVVRVKGTLVPGGARISLLRVRAPAAATVDVRCKGPRCHVRHRSVGGGRVAVLERFLRAGTRITIRVSMPGSIGKYVRLVIRDGSAPKRRDACLMPGGTEPAGCPSP